MTRFQGLGWAAVVALMWLEGGAFLPGQLASVSAALVILAAVGMGVGLWSPDAAERLLLGALALAALGLALVRADALGGLERLGWWGLALAALAAARRLPFLRWETVALTSAGFWVAAAAVAEAWVLGFPRAGGLFENPNVAAALLVPLLAWVPGLPLPSPVRWGLGTVLVAGLAATGSRAGLLAAVVLALFAAPRALRRWWPLGLVLAAAVFAWRLAAWHDPLAWRRPAIWKASAQVVLHHPLLGASAGGFDEAVLPYRPEEPTTVARWSKRPDSAESTPLQLAAEAGLPACFLVLGGVLLLARGAWRDGAPPTRGLVASLAVLGTVHDMLGVPVVLWSWAWMLGRAAGSPRDPDEQRPGTWAGVALGLAVGLLLARATVPPELALRSWAFHRDITATSYEPLFALPWRRRAELALKARSWSWEDAAAAVDAAQRAVHLHRASAGCWLVLGECAARAARELAMVPSTVELAERAYRRAAALDPHSPWARLGWARFERDRGRLDRALALVRRALAEEPNLVRGWLLMGRIALDRGQVDTARTALEHARAALRRGRGRLLHPYERALLAAPPWQLRQLEEALR